MPTSHNTNIEYVARLLRDKDPNTVLDIGAGAGKYGHIARAVLQNAKKIDAVEVWEPYISKYKLECLYDTVFNSDVRKLNKFRYDLVIMGDVLEHMSKEDAQKLWGRVKSQAKYAIFSIPVCDCPQGHVHGNPYEEHVKDDWTHEEVMESFDCIFEYELFDETATYFACFVEQELV